MKPSILPILVFAVFVSSPCLAQVTFELGPAEFEFDPATGQPVGVWEVPLLVSGGMQPVLGFSISCRFEFNGFLHSNVVSHPCQSALSGDLASAAFSSIGFTLAGGVFASAEYIQTAQEYSDCISGQSLDRTRRELSVGVVESLQGPFSGFVLDALVPVGSLEISLAGNALLNDLDGATIAFFAGSILVPPVSPEVTYQDGSSESASVTTGTISMIRANSFKRGHFEAGALTISDAIRSLLYLFGGGAAPECLDSVDADDSGVLDLSDPLRVLAYLFEGGPAPVNPFSQCGVDQTLDSLDCAIDICQ